MLKTINAGLMGSIFPQIMWAPRGVGGGGGIPEDSDDGGDDNSGADDFDEVEEGEDDHLEQPRRKKDDSQDDDEISLESKDFLEQFWDDEDDDDDGDDDDDEAGDSVEAQKALGEELKGMIQGFKITEDMIPEDFDPTDPKQFRDVVGKIQQQSIALALKAVFKPMAAALNQQQVRMRKEYQSYVQEHSTGSSIRSRLTEEIPATGEKKHRQVVNLVLKQAAARFPKDTENQFRAARKALAAIGIDKNTRSSTGGRRESSDNDFSSVLDSFAPMPKRSANSRVPGRMRPR